MEFKHISVLLNETIHSLKIKPDGIYVDGTLGGAGHSSQIAKRLTTGRLIGIDRDPVALKAAGEREKIVFLHYPPVYLNYECPGILEMLTKYDVHSCYYGHIHSNGCRYAFIGERDNVYYRLISADYLEFVPLKIR